MAEHSLSYWKFFWRGSIPQIAEVVKTARDAALEQAQRTRAGQLRDGKPSKDDATVTVDIDVDTRNGSVEKVEVAELEEVLRYDLNSVREVKVYVTAKPGLHVMYLVIRRDKIALWLSVRANTRTEAATLLTPIVEILSRGARPLWDFTLSPTFLIVFAFIAVFWGGALEFAFKTSRLEAILGSTSLYMSVTAGFMYLVPHLQLVERSDQSRRYGKTIFGAILTIILGLGTSIGGTVLLDAYRAKGRQPNLANSAPVAASSTPSPASSPSASSSIAPSAASWSSPAPPTSSASR